ncbi:MAG: hypothetical protein HKN37_12195 [Rhodothermales bacterium]|nr:hypothetical protein [Rhodothermales bacterium]
MSTRFQAATWFLTLLVVQSTATAQLRQLETENVRIIYYSSSHEYVIPHVARSFENAWAFHRQLFDYTPREKVSLLIEDFGDFGNGGAENVPRNSIVLGISPSRHTYGADLSAERLFSTMNHETAHVVALDRSSGSDRFFRGLFGGKVAPTDEDPVSMFYSYLTSPRRYAPRWYHEGFAVFIETWMAGGLGRSLAGYDEMVFRTMVRDSIYIYDFVGLESEGTTRDFQVGVNSYLYGTRFMSYLANQHGAEQVIQWVARSDSSRKGYSAQFKRVFGVTLDSEWSNWITFEKKWQSENLDQVRSSPITPFRPVLEEGLGSVSRPYYDSKSGLVYLGVRYPGSLGHIAALNPATGAMKKTTNVLGPALFYVTSLALDEDSRTIFYTTDNNAWRDLHSVNIETRKSKTLQTNFRSGDLAFNRGDRSLWAVRHYDGLSTIIRISPPYDKWDPVYTYTYGQDIYDLDISPDGNHLVGNLSYIGGKQLLVRYALDSLRQGKEDFETLFDFEHSAPLNFSYSPDGKFLYGASYYSGVSNIYRYSFEAEEMQIITNAESGFFRPIVIPGDSLFAFTYTGEGFQPVVIPIGRPDEVSATRFLGTAVAEGNQVVKDWQVGSPRDINLDSLTVYRGPYRPLANTAFTSWYPVVAGYGDDVAVGTRLNFSDDLGLSSLQVKALVVPNRTYPDDERFHGSVDFRYWNWRVSATYNRADFYDLFGPTKTSRKGYSLGINYGKSLIDEDSKKVRYDLNMVGWGGLERLPDAQNRIAPFSELLAAGGSVSFSSLRKSLGAVDDEKGYSFRVFNQNNFVNRELYPRFYTTLDLGTLLPISHSSVWLRTAAGVSIGDRDNPFANFFFGGFGNNWVDHQDEKRYRAHYSFPGVEINQLGGTNFVKGLAEWNLPPVRFRRIGFPNLYLRWARPALFASGILTNIDSDDVRTSAANAGAQIDFRFVTFSYLPITISVGYAAAWPDGLDMSDEFMLSVKILD